VGVQVKPVLRPTVARLAAYAGYDSLTATFHLPSVVTGEASLVAFDRTQAQLVGNRLGFGRTVQRVERAVVRRLHPLLHLRLVALSASVCTNDRRWSALARRELGHLLRASRH